ncbi:peptidylprolyl isomerase [Prevotella sp. oral taxon 313]|jgi:peptidyl-prolyl cis-trans isomerase|uniref:FKBP-type peptidyl-prolyl cis-trans isomerase n=1 Tax=Prevotella sp. oral taxon 313 TaxID=652722 RepID=UPI000D1F264A|nr:FKBP-type peptidyl-prolyl cis-trans isomerase [Prevotella sp. oral taxon 313]PTL31686.1 peptidylprolyl isomerase [Prevotella sp. oral taxon 313]
MTKNIKTLIGIFCLGGMMLSAGLFTSCTENDDTVEEYANWQSKNETYWDNLYTTTQQKIKGGDISWKIILNYTFQNQKQTTGSALTYRPENYIIAHVEQAGTGTTSPLYSDSVSMHYMGRLIPSTTYTSGLIFDKSWSSNQFNAATSRPVHSYIGLTYDAEGKPTSLVDGFTTALMSMHRGDHWTVYIPYQLGYGEKNSGVVPAYSTLIFDLRLNDFSHPGVKLKD